MYPKRPVNTVSIKHSVERTDDCMSSIYITPQKLMEEEKELYKSEPKYLFVNLKDCVRCGNKPELKYIYYRTPGFDYLYFKCPICGYASYMLATDKKSARYWWNNSNRRRLLNSVHK